jgi:hypothetical protein
MTPKMWRLKNGYKMSRKARNILGIKDDTASKLAIGQDGDKLCIKAVSDTDPNNALVSKLNMIANTGMVQHLDTFGNAFTITNNKTDEGYFIMEAHTDTEETTDTDNTDTTTESHIAGQTPEDVLTEEPVNNTKEEGEDW